MRVRVVDNSAVPTSEFINELIKDHETARDTMIADYQKYRGESLDILTRSFDDTTKINRKLANDFRGEIVDQIVGYLFGKPVTYTLDKAVYPNEGAYNKDNTEFDGFLWRTRMPDLDAETAKQASIMGCAVRLCYIDSDGEISVTNIDPWEVIFVGDSSAMRYYQIGSDEHWYVEWYDHVYKTIWEEDGTGIFKAISQEPHLFGVLPLIEFPNNEERLPDFRKVESLIDAYDLAMSDAQNELEEQRLAYLAFTGEVVITPETVQAARQTGAFNIPEGGDAKFLIKQINDAFLENHKKTLRENIYRFSRSVDMTDESFSGATQSGEARKWKLLALENRASTKERKFEKSLITQFDCLSTAWLTKGFSIQARSVSWTFDRNIPVELSSEAQTTALLRGMVSERTRLENLSIVRDVEQEIAEMAEEATVDLDAAEGGEGTAE